MSHAPRLRPVQSEPDRLRVADQPLPGDGLIEPLLSVADLCRLLQCDRRTIERMRSAGRLPGPDLCVGRRLPRWRVETIRSWIERGGCQ
jgi:hypothetical protein